MTLTVENGSGVQNANSYISVADARAYATARGATLPADDTQLEASILKGMDYIEAQRSEFQGGKTYTGVPGFWSGTCFDLAPPSDVDSHDAQALQWPRFGVYVDNIPISGNAIPKELVSALAQCVIEISAGADLQENTDQMIKSEKVDVVETVYMTATDVGSTGLGKTFPKVEALLAPLYKVGGFLTSVRI